MNAIVPAQTQSPAFKATLKWFDVEKGHGFVVLDSDKSDVFLHITILKRAGIESLGQGARLLCRTKCSDRGTHVAQIVSVLNPGIRPASIETSRVAGTVKWYDKNRDYGSIGPDDGGTEIYVSAKHLTKLGLDRLVEGTRVIATVRQGRNNTRQAVDLKITQYPISQVDHPRANKKAAG